MLPVALKEFKVVYIFLLLFLCHYQLVKGHFYQKSGRLQPSQPHPLPTVSTGLKENMCQFKTDKITYSKS